MKLGKLCSVLSLIFISSNVMAKVATKVPTPAPAAETVSNPCSHSPEMLNIVDRPTVGDSVCVVPYLKTMVELGYQYQDLTHSAGHAQNFPEAEFRLGLPWSSEFVLVLPNYNHSTVPGYGYSATTVGIKHELGFAKKWVAGAESLITLPNGSSAFGSQGYGIAVNGLLSYNYTPKINFSFMLGATSETASVLNGGQRFTSINPDVVATYTAGEKTNLYAEIYAQSKTAPNETSGSNVDAGIIYLLYPNMTVDFELGQRIYGKLAGINHYVGAGMAVMF